MATGEWNLPGYTELRRLGAGGGGRVVLARHDESGAQVAIKYLAERLRDDPHFLARFRTEARLLVELVDENVVQLYEYVEVAGGAAIVMEAIDGVSLRELLREHGSTGPEAALAVLKGSLMGLSAAHLTGVVHRDYKPENVLVRSDGASKLVDFGIAVQAGEADRPAGTPPYMAPEQWAGGPASPATDVYAATAVFFECLTGHRPYRAIDPAVLMHQHRNAPIPAEEVPEPIRALVTRGMAKDPMDRPATAAGFVVELEAAAVAGYGQDWEERGRHRLATLAALLPLLFRVHPPEPSTGTTLFRTVLGALQKKAAGVAIGAGLVVIAGGTSAYVLAGARAPEVRRIETAAAQPSPSPSPEPPGPATFSPAPSPSESPSTAPSESPSANPGGAGPTAGPSGGPSAEPSPFPTGTGTARPPVKTPKPTPTVTASPSPTRSPEPTPSPSPTPTRTPSPSQTPTPSPSQPEVRGVDVLRAGVDARGAAVVSVAVTTGNSQRVSLNVAFRVGQAVQRAVVPLSGETRYTRTFRFAFPGAACGSTWNVVATTDPPGGSGSASGRTTPCAEPTPEPTPKPTPKPTSPPEPTPRPTATRTPRPTISTPKPTATRTPRPTISTPKPTATRTPRPTVTPKPSTRVTDKPSDGTDESEND
ncbi:protein kinase [Streptosporangium sp. NPDC000396]|uniref:serine/threonine-protein kinase n=1 Tax=Streptosporangium sp. NPDC000396 TaxID=3366185 RepID=UPI00368803BA